MPVTQVKDEQRQSVLSCWGITRGLSDNRHQFSSLKISSYNSLNLICILTQSSKLTLYVREVDAVFQFLRMIITCSFCT